MKQLLAWTGSADSTITSEAVMAMAEKFNAGQEVRSACRSQRARSNASQRGHLWGHARPLAFVCFQSEAVIAVQSEEP